MIFIGPMNASFVFSYKWNLMYAERLFKTFFRNLVQTQKSINILTNMDKQSMQEMHYCLKAFPSCNSQKLESFSPRGPESYPLLLFVHAKCSRKKNITRIYLQKHEHQSFTQYQICLHKLYWGCKKSWMRKQKFRRRKFILIQFYFMVWVFFCSNNKTETFLQSLVAFLQYIFPMLLKNTDFNSIFPFQEENMYRFSYTEDFILFIQFSWNHEDLFGFHDRAGIDDDFRM